MMGGIKWRRESTVQEGEVITAGIKSLLVRGEGSGSFSCRHRPPKGVVCLCEGRDGEGVNTLVQEGWRGRGWVDSTCWCTGASLEEQMAKFSGIFVSRLLNHWQLELGSSGNIYTIEIGM